jgi:3-phosphoglycerate kinase
LRFHIEETNNDKEFARFLSRYGDIYINDAFGACHRAHASIVGVPEFLPSGMGLLLEDELKNLGKLTKNPKKPMIAIIGGAKVETKAGVIDRISEVADYVLVSGLIKKEIDEKGTKFVHPEKIVGPVDAVQFEGKEPDIGPKTVELFKSKIKNAKTIFWNGPLGQIEKEEFSKGTFAVAQAISQIWFCFTAVGGGETVEFLDKAGLADKFDYVSTGGGAMLEYLSGEQLPGLTALMKGGK